MTERRPTRMRCAIYTRKSSEEGLEQAFNSLHAQREACEAYVKSQQHEGWSVIPTIYNDGGFSGGSMERPALQRLLQDVRDRKVDVVVVYKIDRLTRSLFDFAKIVEIFDAASASFVSVTQSFNTTTSMGRLTLNVLLSFAQFEREVTGERIRDKIAASRRKGMFMGGNVPLGYDLSDHRLLINEEEAETVRTIFELYPRLGSVRLLKAELDRLGLRTKRRSSKDGSQRQSGGELFGVGHLYYLLKNPIYIGSVRHKGAVHPGRHEPIIAIDAWIAVQTRLADQAVDRESKNATSPSLLVGRVFDDDGHRLTPTHAAKGSRRYRYYATTTEHRPVLRLPAADLERAVLDAVAAWLGLFENIATIVCSAEQSIDAFEQATMLATHLRRGGGEAAAILQRLLHRAEVGKEKIVIQLQRQSLREMLGVGSMADANNDHIVIEDALLFASGRKARKLIIGSNAPRPRVDAGLAAAILRARRWFEQLRDRHVASITELAEQEAVPRAWISQQLSLAFLAPDIVEAIAAGRQPASLTVDRLSAIANVSSDWAAQRTAVG